jgi:hypothetical protein
MWLLKKLLFLAAKARGTVYYHADRTRRSA